MKLTRIRIEVPAWALALTLGLGGPTAVVAEGLAAYYPEPEGVWLQTGNDRFFGIDRSPREGTPRRGLVLLVPGADGDLGGLDRDLGLPLSRRGWRSLIIASPQGPTPGLAKAAAVQRIRFAIGVLAKDPGPALFVVTRGRGLEWVLAATDPPPAQPLRGLIWLDPHIGIDPSPLVKRGIPLLAIGSGNAAAKGKGIERLSLPPGTTGRWRAARIAAWLQRIAGQVRPSDPSRTEVKGITADH